jgi:hypothetical protein
MNETQAAILVPKLCLGTHLSSKLCFAVEGNRVAGDIGIPKQSLGTRRCERVGR